MWLRIALLCLLAWPALADQIRLANGDRITGEIKARTGERLVVDTGYAGEISVRLSDVRSIVLEDAAGARHEIGPLEVESFDPAAYRTVQQVTYAGRALVSAAYARGNTESDQVHLDGDFTARAKAYRYNLSGRIDRRAEPPADTNTAWLAGANYDRFLDVRRFAYVRASLEHDRAKDVDYRAAAGAGYGVQILEDAAANVSVRGGLDYVAVERLFGAREEYPAFGWGVKTAFAPWGPRLQLFHEQEGFWNLEDSDVVIVRSKTGLRLPLIERLNATAQLNLDWERRPAPGRVSTDSTLLFGVDYAF
jgi:hypothetical protein